jgi:hypothetical protein
MKPRDLRYRTALSAALLVVALCLPGCTRPATATTTTRSALLASSTSTSLPAGLLVSSTLPSSAAHVVYAVGDDTFPGNEAVSRRLADLVPLPASGLELFVYLGDVQLSGSVADFQRYDNIWGGGGHDLRSKTASLLGNHETASRSTGWIPYWKGSLFPDWPGSLTQTDPPYYAVKLGDWKLIMLDTNSSVRAGSPQYDFLVAELTEKGYHTIVCGHHPRWSNGMHGDGSDLADAWKAMCDYDAVAYLAAHDHGSQVQPPRDRDGNAVQAEGVVQLVAGAGGAPLYPFPSGTGRAPADWKDDTHYCVVRLTLRAGDLQADFIAADGSSIHSQQFDLAPSLSGR